MPLDSLGRLLGYCGGWETASEPFLPYLDHCTDQAMLLRDGSVLGMARLPGAPFPLLGNVDRNGNVIRTTAFLNAAADDNVEIFIHLVRHDNVPEMPPRPPAATAFDAMFMADYNADVQQHLRVNDWFLSVLVRPRKSPFARLGDAIKKLAPGRGDSVEEKLENAAASHEDRIAQLEDVFSFGLNLLRPLHPVRLGRRMEGKISFSEIAEALELIRTTKSHKQPMVAMPGTLGAGLAAHDPIAGRGGFEVRYGQGGFDSHFGTVLGITSYPEEIWQDRFDDLLSLDGRFSLTNHLRFMNRAQQQEHLNLLKRMILTSDDVNLDAAADMLSAAREVAKGASVQAFSRWSLALHCDGVPDPDPKKIARSAMRKVDKLVSQAKSIMVNAGFRVAPEGKGAKSALIAQTPGAPRRCHIRAGTLPTDYVASMATMGGFARGPSEHRWSGPLLRYATTGGTGFLDDLFVGEGDAAVGHCVVAGPNGSGKTVWLGANITAARALVRAGRKPGTQILLDIDHSNEQTILANGGSYVPIEGDGNDSGVAPLLLTNSRIVRAMLRTLIARLTQMDGQKVSADDIVGIRQGVDFVMNEMAPEQRHLGIIRSFMSFEADGAGARLERWCRQFNGDLAWVFDGTKHLIDFDVELAGVDLTAIKENALVMPPMGWLLLWLASQMMDGRRCIIWCEEAPAYLDKPEFSSVAKGLALRGRKRNTCFIPIAQMPEHLLSNEAGKAIVKQARKRVLFRNETADRDDYCNGLGVSEPIFNMVQRGMFQLPYHAVVIVRSDGQSSINRFDLSSLKKYLQVFSGTTNSVALFRKIMQKNGPDAIQENLEEFWRRQSEASA